MTSVVALAGGVGGAKLAHGLASVLGERLAVIINTGDDFEHVGFHVSPDLDTVMYTLAGIANAETGWGVSGESWNFMEQLARLGGPEWFRLGDRDLATHSLRTERLRAGKTLTAVTMELCRSLGVAARVLPMSDERIRTVVHTEQGALDFQDYFVRLKAQVPVTRIEISGGKLAAVTPEIAALKREELSAIIICPSNPYLSIDPILSVAGIRGWIAGAKMPVVAVSPIVGGAAIKGPAAKIMTELGVRPTALEIARHYRGLIAGLVIDTLDVSLAGAIEVEKVRVHVTNTIMRTDEDRAALAKECLAFSRKLAAEGIGSAR